MDEASDPDPRAALEGWLACASRKEMMQRTLETEDREKRLDEAFAPGPVRRRGLVMGGRTLDPLPDRR